MWHIITAEELERDKQGQMDVFKQMQEEQERKRKAREAHDAAKCPHCGRNDPLPPWLY